MTRGMRWRIYTLQVGLIGILAFVAALAYGTGSFVQSQVHDQLAAQQIFFPPATTEIKGGALDPAEFSDLQPFAGQQVVNGDQAKAYANGFIGRHLGRIAGGLTYSQVSAKAMADPTNSSLAGQVQTLFRGETLRGLLLNAYGWWTVAQYAIYAALGLAIAAFAVLGALVFEVFAARREVRETAKGPAGKPVRAPVPA